MATPAILLLPLELRQHIYAYLLPKENVSHPLPSVGITSVSHRLPAFSLLRIHPQLTDEILDYFFNASSWKLIFSHAFNFFRTDAYLHNLEKSTVLRHIRRVEIVFFCDILLLREYPSFGLESFCEEIRRRCDRACDVLAHAENLSSVTVSWIDTTLTGGWEEKAKVLQPLRKLNAGGDVTFRIGEINGPEQLDRETFIKAMQDVLGESQHLESGGHKAEDEVAGPSSMRMLAFDPRQERRKIAAGRMMERPCNCCGGARGVSVLQEVPADN